MRKIKSFSLFESAVTSTEDVTSTEEVLSIVKEILMELDFLDISYNAVIRRDGNLDYDLNGVELIRVSIWKPINQETLPKRWMRHEDMPMTFSQRDISSVVSSIKDYLLSEGWIIDDEKDLYNCGIWDGDSYINLRTQYQIRFKRRRVI